MFASTSARILIKNLQEWNYRYALENLGQCANERKGTDFSGELIMYYRSRSAFDFAVFMFLPTIQCPCVQGKIYKHGKHVLMNTYRYFFIILDLIAPRNPKFGLFSMGKCLYKKILQCESQLVFKYYYGLMAGM